MKHTPAIIAFCLQLSLMLLAQTHAAQTADPYYGKVKPDKAAVIVKLEAGQIETPVQMPWRLYVPPAASKENPLPLIVFLHGAGMRGADNVGPMSLAWSFITPEAQAKHPCFVFAAQVAQAHSWVNQNFNKGSYNSDQIKITDELTGVLTMTDKLINERPIDSHRVYVVGQSMGGYGAWDAMIRRPDLWAAAVPICGAGDPTKAESIKSIPVWAWHGEMDTNVPVSGSRDMVAALTKAGGNPKYTEVPKAGHGVWNNAFADPQLYEWLFSQRKP